jgi:HEPN domain-containing protein
MDNKTTLVKNWLIKAIHDLAVSKKLKTDEEQYLDVAIYHCQQAAEKAIKRFLVLHGKEFPKTHDLRFLVQLAVSVNSERGYALDCTTHHILWLSIIVNILHVVVGTVKCIAPIPNSSSMKMQRMF